MNIENKINRKNCPGSQLMPILDQKGAVEKAITFQGILQGTYKRKKVIEKIR